MRPVAKARASPAGSDTDLDSDTQASLVLCNNRISVLTNPTSIMKPHNEGPWLSLTQHALAPTTCDPALSTLSALKTGLQPQPEASTQHSPPRTRRIQVSSIISVISQEDLEMFEKQEFRDFHRSNSKSTFKHEVFPKELLKQALSLSS